VGGVYTIPAPIGVGMEKQLDMYLDAGGAAEQLRLLTNDSGCISCTDFFEKTDIFLLRKVEKLHKM
jgi:hypothetical protein